MAQLGGTFDVNNAEKRQSFPVITGWHAAQIIESDVAATRNGQGQRAALTFEVIEGDYRGRKVWHGINFQHTNPETQRIGQSELRELCEAIGLGQIDNTEVLHFKPMMVKFGPEKSDPERTAVKGYRAYGQTTARTEAPAAQPAAAEPAQAAGGGFRPSGAAPAQAAAGGQRRPWAS